MVTINPIIFKYYFYFMQERMNIFWRKQSGVNKDYTKDDILKTYKFTNVYRACDRVSQYLIKNVIYSSDNIGLNEIDIMLRIIIFKIFNKIETWEYIKNEVGILKTNNFNLDKISKALSYRKSLYPIFSNAYMMTGSHSKYSYLEFKHDKWLVMVKKELLEGKVFENILKSKSLEQIYVLLHNCSFMGDFLGYQYAIDLNYSSFINYDENSFVKAGIGSIRGIKKCFSSIGQYSYEDVIRFTHDNLNYYREVFNFSEFVSLFGREPKLIDIQNCFCETDKYLRAKIPELKVDNVRIKQKYKETKIPLSLFFPPKWNLKKELEFHVYS